MGGGLKSGGKWEVVDCYNMALNLEVLNLFCSVMLNSLSKKGFKDRDRWNVLGLLSFICC
jgi:hypothetical protein